MTTRRGPPETASTRPQIRCSSSFWAEWLLFSTRARPRVDVPNSRRSLSATATGVRHAANRGCRHVWNISDEFIQQTRPTMYDLVTYVRSNNLYDVPPEKFEEYRGRRVEDVRKGISSGNEMRLLDGRVIQFEIRPLPDGGRMLTYFDITDLKRSEEAAKKARDAAEFALSKLRTAQDRLVQTEKLASLGQLTAGIAHEMKDPLNFVNNFSALAADLVDEMGDVIEGSQSG